MTLKAELIIDLESKDLSTQNNYNSVYKKVNLGWMFGLTG